MDLNPYDIITTAIVVVMSLTIHELAHARTALAFGDPTAKLMGRVTLNPLAHLDLWGTIAMFVSSLAGAGIGWAKPVPVNPANIHPQRLGNAMVSLAGPMSNIFLALLAAGLVRLMVFKGVWPNPNSSLHAGPFYSTLADMLFMLMMCNFSLAMFNLIPLFPLDGHHIQRELLPVHHQAEYMQWQYRYGRFVLLAIIFLPPMLSRGLNLHRNISPLHYVTKYVILPVASHLSGLSLGFKDEI